MVVGQAPDPDILVRQIFSRSAGGFMQKRAAVFFRIRYRAFDISHDEVSRLQVLPDIVREAAVPLPCVCHMFGKRNVSGKYDSQFISHPFLSCRH